MNAHNERRDCLRVRHEILVADLTVPRSQPLSVAPTLANEPSPIDGRLAERLHAEVGVQVGQRHIPSVTDEVDEAEPPGTSAPGTGCASRSSVSSPRSVDFPGRSAYRAKTSRIASG